MIAAGVAQRNTCAGVAAAVATIALLSLPAPARSDEAVAPAAGSAVAPVRVFSASQRAESEANRQALQSLRNAPPVEQPRHRLPDGSLTSAPGRTMLEALPLAAEPNAVTRWSGLGSSFSSRKGFTGIRAGDNVTANHYELEPPDQGLAVNNNVAAEINNNVTRFFNATSARR